MKFLSALMLATATLVNSAPAGITPTSTLERRADMCGQWDSVQTGHYDLYNNLWDKDAASSGSQCTTFDGLSGNTIKWHTKWSWAGAPSSVKSYANAVHHLTSQALSAYTTILTTWSWSYSGSSVTADVAYDMFTSSSAGSSAEYEVMVWLAAIGGAGPISSTGGAIAHPKLAGGTWQLYKGNNGKTTVYSFVAVDQIQNFNADLKDFFEYLIDKQGLPSSQVLLSIGAGTEPFVGSNAVFTTTAYSVDPS